MENFQRRFIANKDTGLFVAFLMLLASYSTHTHAEEMQQTLVLIGGALTTCSSMSSDNCENKTQLDGKKSNQYQLSDEALNKIKSQWVNDNVDNRNKVLQLLSTIAAKQSKQIDKSTLLWAWRDLDNGLLNSLSDQEYNFVFDMLEIPVLDVENKRIKEVVNTKINKEHSANDILNFISATAKINVKKPTLLAITASSRDPYESADFYEGLLNFDGIEAHWLALTPALAQAISTGKCEDLGRIREQSMQLFNRDKIYTDRIHAEQKLCAQGIDNLLKTINSATGVMLNGGDQSLTRKVMYDDNGKLYPWTQAIRTRPLLIGTSAGTAIQSGGENQAGKVAMITNGTSLSALREGAHALAAPSERCTGKCSQGLTADSVTYQPLGGLGSFNMGVLDTHFSERNRTVRLATVLNATKQQHGFGIDETTALVVINSAKTQLMTVVGKNGVVYLNAPSEDAMFHYSYWPAGAVIDVTATGFKLNQRTLDNVLPEIKMPPLPMQRFSNILTDAKLRSLTQAMCLSQDKTAVGQQDEFLVTLNATEQTQYHRLNSSNYGCAITQLNVDITTIQ